MSERGRDIDPIVDKRDVVARAESTVLEAEAEAIVGPLEYCQCGTAAVVPDGWTPGDAFTAGQVLGMKCAGCGQPSRPHIARDVPDPGPSVERRCL
jgi:hypothetical protein